MSARVCNDVQAGDPPAQHSSEPCFQFFHNLSSERESFFFELLSCNMQVLASVCISRKASPAGVGHRLPEIREALRFLGFQLEHRVMSRASPVATLLCARCRENGEPTDRQSLRFTFVTHCSSQHFAPPWAPEFWPSCHRSSHLLGLFFQALVVVQLPVFTPVLL